MNLITISLSNLLLHIIQKEKIAPKIAAKFAHVNGPLVTFKNMGDGALKQTYRTINWRSN